MGCRKIMSFGTSKIWRSSRVKTLGLGKTWTQRPQPHGSCLMCGTWKYGQTNAISDPQPSKFYQLGPVTTICCPVNVCCSSVQSYYYFPPFSERITFACVVASFNSSSRKTHYWPKQANIQPFFGLPTLNILYLSIYF